MFLVMKRFIATISALSALTLSSVAFADTTTIDVPGVHTSYIFEAEPHALLEPFDPLLPGGGFRGTIELVDNGFIKSINNTVGIGFGADFTRDTIRIPVVMQWNFFLSNRWSVFGEPGAAIIVHDRRDRGRNGIDHFAFYAGGRWHFAERMTLTMRLGKPAFSVGVSFLL
jgi:hypothetical protein